MSRRGLCVCADDFGLHPLVNAAVLRLIQLGRLQATGAMVGAPAWRDGARALAEVAPDRVDVGLHLDLTQFPLTLAPRGLLRWLLAGAGTEAELRREVTAQLDAFEAAMGRAPDYVDGHQHVHQFPRVRDALLDVLADRYPHRRPWLRSTRRGTAGFKPALIQALGQRSLSRRAALLGIRQNRRLLGVYDFDGDAARYAARLQGWLHVSGDGDLLMCHPAAGPVPGDPIAEARQWEYELLASPRFAAELHRLGIAPLPMTRLLAPRA
ncbi:ChbG/HpnK family deacetylase [Roseateles aquatilis]|nr:ChbG/HpnK family deacetylase [Roseateles aquatilis]